MVPQNDRRACLCWWEAFAPCLGQLLRFDTLSLSIALVRNICAGTCSCCCSSRPETPACSQRREQCWGAKPSPPLQGWLALHAGCHPSPPPWTVQYGCPAGGQAGSVLRTALLHRHPLLQLASPSCWVRADTLPSRELRGLAGELPQRPGRAGCRRTLPLLALLEGWWRGADSAAHRRTLGQSLAPWAGGKGTPLQKRGSGFKEEGLTHAGFFRMPGNTYRSSPPSPLSWYPPPSHLPPHTPPQLRQMHFIFARVCH